MAARATHHEVRYLKVDGKIVDFTVAIVTCAPDDASFSLRLETPQGVILPPSGYYDISIVGGRSLCGRGVDIHPDPWTHDVIGGMDVPDQDHQPGLPVRRQDDYGEDRINLALRD